MLDISISYNRYKFLGYEFLTWLWFLIEKDPEKFKNLDKNLVSFEIGNRMALENNRAHDNVEIITIKGDEAGLEEGMTALKKGAVVTEMNLVYTASGNQEWRFTLKGENFDISNLKTPETGKVEAKEDIEGALLEKISLYEKALLLVDALFKHFIQLRISKDWHTETLPGIKNWIFNR